MNTEVPSPMTDRTRLGLGVLEAALLLGLLGDALLRVTPWGINILLWAATLGVAVWTVPLCWGGAAAAKEKSRLMLPMLFFAAAFAWRDSPTLRFLDGLGVALVLLLMASPLAQIKRMRVAGLVEYAREVITALGRTVFGMIPLLRRDVAWKEIPHNRWSGHARAVARGLLVAVPLLLLFGGLLAAADAVFERVIDNAFGFDLSNVFTHILVTASVAWIVGGFLRAALLESKAAEADSLMAGKANVNDGATRPEPQRGAPNANGFLSPGVIEIGVVMGSLNLLFLSFVVVQLRYFFGGAELIESTVGLTYAEYARRGFFELVAVAALVLPILLVADWLVRRGGKLLCRRIFRLSAGTLIWLLFVIMASAVQRMRLYQGEYGLTELRFYTTVFMGWLALVFVWFVLTVLRDRRQRFAFGALVAGFLLIGGLHVLNPDELIVRTNISHTNVRRSFDADYAASLSADAVPALIKALPGMNGPDRRLVAHRLLERFPARGHADWRSWNWARARARRTVHGSEALLRKGISQNSLEEE